MTDEPPRVTDLQEPAPAPSSRRSEQGVDLWISRLIRLAGLGIAIYETVATQADRTTLLGTALLMMTGSLAYDAIRRKVLS